MFGGTWYRKEDLLQMDNEHLVEAFQHACSVNNEMDNRSQVELIRKILLQRLNKPLHKH